MVESGGYMDRAFRKLERLEEYIRELDSVAVAFSGGVDSTFLMEVSRRVLGDRAIAVTAIASSMSEKEMTEAAEFCKSRDILHEKKMFDVLSIPGFSVNPHDRCYICKVQLMKLLKELADTHGIKDVIEGSNVDDMGDYRPGMKAVEELGILSPLMKAELTKEEIRFLSKHLGLPTWDKPSYACLASRFVYGETITKEKLEMVDKAESMLREMGFSQVRVRIHGEKDYLARIEVGQDEISNFADCRKNEKICKYLKQLGFIYVTIDISGYRTGSMNENIFK